MSKCDWLILGSYLYGIILGVWFGWMKWREPKLQYEDESDEH